MSFQVQQHAFIQSFCLALVLMSCRAASPSEDTGSKLQNEDSTARMIGDASELLQLPTAATAAPATCPSSAAYKIVGGQTLNEGDLAASSVVKIWIRKERSCTATLVGPQQIVTAAHCLKDVSNAEELTLGYGPEPTSRNDLKIKSFRVHPQFKGIVADANGIYKEQPFFDIALLVFDGKLEASMRPVSIGWPQQVFAGMNILLAGYGAYSSDDRLRRPLSQAKLEVATLRPEFKELQLQAGVGKGACFGDSGGPTFIPGEGGACLLLIGSTTGPGRLGNYTCEAGGATVMDLTRYRSWIACTFQELGAPVADLNSSEACPKI